MSDLFRVKGVTGSELKYLPTLTILREKQDNKYSPEESRGFAAGKREG